MDTGNIISIVTASAALITSSVSLVRKQATQDAKTKATLDNHDDRIKQVTVEINDLRSGFTRIYDKLDALSQEMHRQNVDVLQQLIKHMGDSAASRGR